MNRHVAKGKVKRAVCRVAGHVPYRYACGEGQPDVRGMLVTWVYCSRCGHLLAMEEVPTHV